MTHIPESEFQVIVHTYLDYEVGEDSITKEPTLPSGRRPDFVVDNEFTKLAIEVENEHKATYESVGQALAYAEELSEINDEEYRPVVIVPDYHDKDINLDELYLTEQVEYKKLKTAKY